VFFIFENLLILSECIITHTQAYFYF
ncbi:uncharacterized protein METZ01_LOCUS130042, partial [marine metagenome]